MEFYEAVEKRRTIRDFEDVSIPEDVMERILDAGMKAPSNDHMRDWHFLVIQDKMSYSGFSIKYRKKSPQKK
jgi:nitroreductase